MRVKIFCVTKNEYDIIEDFILYYGNLFGYDNIIIIDNNSSNNIVLEIYNKYKLLGVTIYYESRYDGNSQGDNFNKYMSIYKDTCDYLIGLDTDEFLFSYIEFKNNNDPFNKEKILEIFSNYKITDTLFKIDYYPCSIVDPTNNNYIDNKIINPIRNIIYFSNDMNMTEIDECNWKWCYTPKYFSKSNAFINTSNGNHHINISYGNEVNSNLGLLHFNNTGNRRYYERAKAVIDGYKYFSTDLNIKDQIDILKENKQNFSQGFHKVCSYNFILLRMYIFDLFIKYIKRLPEEEELTTHCKLKINMLSKDIEEEFKNCEECIKNKNLKEIEINETVRNNLIFFDESIDILRNRYIIFENNFLQNLLLSFSNQ